MSNVIDLKPGVDFFPASKPRKARTRRVVRQNANELCGGIVPAINLNAVIDHVAPYDSFLRDVLNLAAKELTRGARVRS